jgi:hypothetical protein
MADRRLSLRASGPLDPAEGNLNQISIDFSRDVHTWRRFYVYNNGSIEFYGSPARPGFPL